MRYTYLGDCLTAPALRGAQCNPVRDARGKCITGKLGTMLVRLADGTPCIVLRRRLRINGEVQP